jgi:hypothetical protein
LDFAVTETTPPRHPTRTGQSLALWLAGVGAAVLLGTAAVVTNAQWPGVLHGPFLGVVDVTNLSRVVNTVMTAKPTLLVAGELVVAAVLRSPGQRKTAPHEPAPAMPA